MMHPLPTNRPILFPVTDLAPGSRDAMDTSADPPLERPPNRPLDRPPDLLPDQPATAVPRRQPARFRTHLLRLALATGLPLVALAIGLAWWIAAHERGAALRDLALTTEALQGDLDRELRITAIALEVLATSPAIDEAVAEAPGGPAAARFWARAVALIERRRTALHNISLFDAAGRPRVNTLAAPGTPLPGLGQLRFPIQGPQPLDPAPYFAAILRGRDSYISPLFIGPLAGRPVISVAMPVRRGEAVIGVLAANLLPHSLGEVLRGQHLRPGAIATLVNDRGMVIARTVREEE